MFQARTTRHAILVLAALASCSRSPLPPEEQPDTSLPRPVLPPPLLPNTPLGTPADVDAVAIDSRHIAVTWTDKSSAESGFRVERAGSADGVWSAVAAIQPNVERYDDYGLDAEQRYCYRVIAFDANDESEASRPDCAVPPAAPASLVASPVEGPGIELVWSSLSGSATSYQVMRAVSPAASMLLATTRTTSYRDAQVQYGRSYMYFVRAVSNDGSSGSSNVVTVALARTPPAPVTNVSAWAASYSIAISWQDNTRDESGSRVERSTDDAKTWTAITTRLADYTEAADTDSKVVNPEHRYCYRIVQFNTSGDGVPSDISCTTTIAPPGDLQAKVITGDSIAFTWTDNSHIERGYQIVVANLLGEGWVADLPANSQSAHLPMQPVFANPANTFYVVAYTDTGTSDGSNGIQFGTASGRLVPRPTTTALSTRPMRTSPAAR